MGNEQTWRRTGEKGFENWSHLYLASGHRLEKKQAQWLG
jgi:hypothetical protein